MLLNKLTDGQTLRHLEFCCRVQKSNEFTFLATKIWARRDSAASSAAQGGDGSDRGQWWVVTQWHEMKRIYRQFESLLSDQQDISGSGIVTKTTLDNTTTVKITSMVSGITNQVRGIINTNELYKRDISGEICCARPGPCQRPQIPANEIQQDWNINCSRYAGSN